jgi:hypothetical protein
MSWPILAAPAARAAALPAPGARRASPQDGTGEGGKIAPFAGPAGGAAAWQRALVPPTRSVAKTRLQDEGILMTSSTVLRRGALTVALTAALGSAAWAQTNPRPAEGRTLSLGGGSGGASRPILTREELRACLQREQTLRPRLSAIEAARQPLDTEKDAIAADQEALRADREAIDERRRRVDDLSARMTAYGERVTDWNARVKELNESPRRGPQADRARVQLNREREELEKQRLALEAEKAELSVGSETMVSDYNAKATALQARIAAWNERNGKWNEDSELAEAERKDWVASCSDRRYREEDELAIKRGR